MNAQERQNKLRTLFTEMLGLLAQDVYAGGIHTPPEMRLILACLARMLPAKNIVETGYDAGFTTEALLLCPGVAVLGIDNLSEYGGTETRARAALSVYPNCALKNADALTVLREMPDASVDMFFIDDWHNAAHVRAEMQEVRRILRPGGLAAFHDTTSHPLYTPLREVFHDWECLELPCISPAAGCDFGLGLTRKPGKYVDMERLAHWGCKPDEAQKRAQHG